MKTRIGSMNALYPMPVVLVGALVKGKPNFITVAHVGILNANAPHLVSIGLGKAHYTNIGIRETNTFSINIPSENLMQTVDYIGLVSGKKSDKSGLFYVSYGELETAPMINNCPVSMECKVVNTIQLPTHDVFIGEIVSTYSDDSVLTGQRIDIEKIKPMLFDMSSRKYYSLGRVLGDCWNTANILAPVENAEEDNLKWNADDYADNSSSQKQWGMELIDKLKLRGDEAVLDIGCGDGKLTALLADRVPDGHVVGIDSSPDMISFAKKAHKTTRNLKFMHIDARKMPFENVFDVAFSNAALHWFKEHDSLLKGLRNGLKAGGRILFQMGGRGNVNDVAIALLRVISKPEWNEFFVELPVPYTFYGPDEYRVLLKHAGLEPARIELIPKDMNFSSNEEMAGWIRTTWFPFTHKIPESMRDNFIHDIIVEYTGTHQPNIDGLISIRAVRLEVEAFKPV